MNILELLRDDHTEVSELLKKISRTRTGKSREKLFVEMKQDVELHAFLEQLIFYSALQNSKEHEAVIQHAQDEHQKIVDLLAELDSLAKDDEQWMPKFRLLKEYIETHVKEEETDLFDRARKTLGEDKLAQLGGLMTTKKAEQLAVQ